MTPGEIHAAAVARADADASLRITCDVCGGRTTTRTEVRTPGGVSVIDALCPRCRGRGWRPVENVPASTRYSYGSDNAGGIHLAVDAAPLLRLSRAELLAMLAEADRAPSTFPSGAIAETDE